MSGHNKPKLLYVCLLTAWFIASLMIWLKNFGIFSSLDNLFINIAQTTKLETSKPTSIVPIKNKTVVLQISNDTWIKTFNQKHPLRRDYLAQTINSIMSLNPNLKEKIGPEINESFVELLVIDLDLSPGQTELMDPLLKEDAISIIDDGEKREQVLKNCLRERKYTQAVITQQESVKEQQCLNHVLAKFANKIVLHKPQIENQNSSAIITWMQNLSKVGITFSSPNLYLHDDKLLKFNMKEANLAVMSFYKTNNIFINKKDGYLNYNGFFANSDILELSYDDYGVPKLSTIGYSHEKGPVVFLGLNKRSHDQFVSPVGKISGVVGHAINYYSIIDTVGKYKIVGYLLEILIGTILGYLLHRIDSLTNEFKYKTSKYYKFIFFRISGIFLPVIVALGLIYFFFELLKVTNFWLSPIVFITAIALEVQYSLWDKAHRHSENSSKNRNVAMSEMQNDNMFMSVPKQYLRQKPIKFLFVVCTNLGAIFIVVRELI